MHKQRNSAAASHTFPSKIATTKQKQQQQQRIKFLLEMRPKQELKVDPELYKAAAPRRCKKMPRGTFKLFDWNKPELVEARTEGRFCFKCDKVFDGEPNRPNKQPNQPNQANHVEETQVQMHSGTKNRQFYSFDTFDQLHLVDSPSCVLKRRPSRKSV